MKRRLIIAACLGAGFATLIILVSSRGRVRDMTFGDGVIYRYVAQHLTAAPAEVDPALGPRGTSLRYGRIGFPLMVWTLSAGQESAMPYAQPAVMVLSGAAIAAATARLFPRGGVALCLAPFVAIGLTASFAGGFAEAPATAMCLWGVVFALDRRLGWAAALFAGAMLTKESSIVALAGTVAWLAVRGRRRDMPVLALSLVPVALWFACVAARYGHIPPLDPWLRSTRSIGPPLVALWQSLRAPADGAVALCAIHVAAAGAVVLYARRSVFWWISAAGLVLFISTGPYVWGFIGDGIRNAALTETAVVLAALASLVPQSAANDEVLARQTAEPGS